MVAGPRDDVPKHLQLAARQAQGLGVVTLVFACFSVPNLLSPRVAGGPGLWSDLFSMLTFALPALSLLIFARHLRQGQYWAVIASLVVGSLGAIFCLFAVPLLFLFGLPPMGSKIVFVVLLPLAIVSLFFVGFCRLIYYLIRSILAIRRQAAEEQRGFALDVLPPPNSTP